MRTDFSLSGALIEVVKKHRLAKKMTMYKLAKLSGLDKSALGKLEAGLRAPSVDTVYKIAMALGVPLWKLVKEAEGQK